MHYFGVLEVSCSPLSSSPLKSATANTYEGCPKSKFPYFIKKQRRDQLELKFIYKYYLRCPTSLHTSQNDQGVYYTGEPVFPSQSHKSRELCPEKSLGRHGGARHRSRTVFQPGNSLKRETKKITRREVRRIRRMIENTPLKGPQKRRCFRCRVRPHVIMKEEDVFHVPTRLFAPNCFTERT